MKKYCLMVRYKDTNEVYAIELNTKWYLEKQYRDIFLRANSLEAIDLVTTRFKNKEEMLSRMKKNGYIRSSDADIFIASKRNRNGKSYIKIHEVIYNPLADERVSDLRNIAKASINNNINKEVERVKKLFDKLANKVFYDEKFSLYLRSTFTNVYQKLTELYVYNLKDEPAYSVKYENYWLLSSYTIIRNIVEAMNRFDLLKNNGNVVLANIDFLNANDLDRKKIVQVLKEKLDDNYIEGQYSLFDGNNVSNGTLLTKEPSKDLNDVEKRVDSRSAGNIGISTEEKRLFIFEMIQGLPVKVFKYITDGLAVNTEFFEEYPNIICKKKFENLSKRAISILYFYALHQEKYFDAIRCGQNTMEWDSEIRKDIASLNKFLSTPRNIDKLDDWLRNYLKCVEYITLTIGLNEGYSCIEGDRFGSKK